MNNLAKLFETQKILDDRIVAEHKLHGQDLLPGTILALQVEIGELANEWQGFKHWKVDPQPKPKMLEEYVDCLHFILSIGNDLKIDIERWTILPVENKNILNQFSQIYYVIGNLDHDPSQSFLIVVLEHFVALGEMLGFSWNQIEQAYYNKNAINHTRQDEGY